ncbi:MAG: EamA family transporter RarD [Gammaproteobacteria bacterium]|nr:EamA family transporter RarD [Gammaproteobacteria bacterium]
MNRGLLLATTAYLIWGFAALYWVQTEPITAPDLVAHRALWALPVLVVSLLLMGRLGASLQLLRQPRTMAIMACSALLQALNWGIFLWAVTHQRATEASLGYFLLPLINVGIGIFLFKERIDRAQQIAVALAAVGMLILIMENRGLPWVALGVSVSFGLYGAVRKAVSVGAVEGLLLETIVMAPFALGWLIVRDGAGFGLYGARVDALLLGAGVMTAVPLMCYVAASRLTALSALGLVFYLGPSCQLLVAICIFGEPMNPVQLFSFALVWLGLGFVAADTLRRYRSMRALRDE